MMLIAMVMVSGLAIMAKPRARVADSRPGVELELVIPKRIGDWVLDESVVPIQPSPDVQAKLNKIYSQTLARTYVNPSAERVMLSIAYGGDQSDTLQVHRPEVCYVSQGFQVPESSSDRIMLPFGTLPVRRVRAELGPRLEHITYWITVGDSAADPGIRQKFVQLSYGLTGKVPDGMLVRVSSIGTDALHAYRIQDGFIHVLLASLDEPVRLRLAGRRAG